MNFESYLQINAKAINEELDLIMADFLNQTKKTNIKLTPFALGLLNSNRGGKRIRGVLVKMGYELAGGGTNPEILKIAGALEILHTALLIHDDIMDKSKQRRGQPTLYRALGNNHYGISQALNIGDIAFFLSVRIITESSFLGEYKIKALNHLSEMIINTGWGQILDIDGKKEDVSFIRLFKTAKYTVAGPLQIGAILAGAEEELLGMLGEFGESLGIAFQIQDDILDKEIGEDEKVKAYVYTAKAKKMISKITEDKNMKKLLEEMSDFMVERTK